MIPSDYEILLGFFLIVTFGIFHGSNDILLIETIANKKTKHPFFRVLTTYIVVVLIAVAVFYFIPILALILFILFSAFHFGEQHWENKDLEVSSLIKHAFYLSYGLLILTILFIFNTEEVKDVIASITKYNISKTIIKFTFVLSAIIFIVLLIYITYKSEAIKKIILREVFYLGIFTLLFKVSTLIWGFTIYFIFWHSLPSLYEQIHFIYGSFDKQNILQYCKNAFPYWLISLIGMGAMYYLFREEQLVYAILFSFIAAITFPHSLVMNKMFKNKKTQPN
jgi:Brp/Blh family beta-carotene 15,15'-monooxygenase